MESFMDDNVFLALLEVIEVIKRSECYQTCIRLKEQMRKNNELLALIEEIKTLQKLYVKSEFQDDKISFLLKTKEKVLEGIPLYVEYNRNLEEVNQMIEEIKDELNSYFLQQVNFLQ